MPDDQADAIAAYVMSLKQPAGNSYPSRRRFGRLRGRGAVLYRKRELRKLPHGARPRWSARARPVQRRPRSQARADRTGVARSGSGARRSGGPRRTRWPRSGSNLSGGDRASARRPDTPGHREEREHIRPATAGRRWQAASAVERPGRGDRARKIADAEGGSDAGGDAQPGRVPQPPFDRSECEGDTRDGRTRAGCSVRRRGEAQARLLAHLQRQHERQPLQPAQPDQHGQCAGTRTSVDLSRSRALRARFKQRRSWWMA